VFQNQSMLRFRLHFLPDMPTLELLTFARQHTEGMVGSIIWVLLEICLASQQ